MQAHTRLRTEIDVLHPEVGDLLHAGTGVIEQQEQRAIAERESSISRQSTKQRRDLVALEEIGLRWRHAFDRDRGHLLCDREILGRPTREEFEERADDREPMIPRAPVILSGRLELRARSSPSTPLETSSRVTPTL